MPLRSPRASPSSLRPCVGASAEPSTPDEAARTFVEDLIQLERLDLRAVYGRVSPELIAPPNERSRLRKTHEVREMPEGPVLKRLHFDCGIHP